MDRSHVDKAQVRAEALAALGLSHLPTQSELKRVWRQVVFDTHPDRHGGDHGPLARAKAAYDLLKPDCPADAPEPVQPERAVPSSVRRPKVESASEPLSDAALAACRDVLSMGLVAEVIDIAAVSGRLSPPDGHVTDHIPDALERRGRRLTYVVDGPIARGANRIVLPTAALQDPRKVRPKIVLFDAADAEGEELIIPDAYCGTAFPGARQVSVRFAAA